MKYSIITINYNNAEGLRRTIESVVKQTCKDYEYIIIDGGSTDGSVDVIKEYADRIDFWVSEPDKGIYNAMNKGISHAHGEYLNFMNSGDCFYAPTVLEEVANMLTADIVSGKDVDERGGRCVYGNDVTLMTFFNGVIPHQSTFIKSCVFDHLKYDENFKLVADWKFFLEALVFKNHSFRNIDTKVCLFDLNGKSSNMKQVKDERMEAFRQLLPERIMKDYLRYQNRESPMLDLIPDFNRTWTFQRLVCKVVKGMTRLYYLFHKRRQSYWEF